MHDLSPLSVHRFSTDSAPVAERFDAWAAYSTYCDFVATYQSDLPFDADREYVRIGPLVLASRTWRHPDHSISYDAKRTAARIRADRRDFYSFTLQLSGSAALRSDTLSSLKQPGELYLLDFASLFERALTPGSEISLSVPRDLLPSDTEQWHGRSMTHGVGSLFGNYLSLLHGSISRLTARDIPHVAEATIQLLIASLQPERDTLRAADEPIRSLLVHRVQRYIDEHLLQPDLSPDRICKDVGLSRARLYRLFENAGGVMREVRRQRLYRVHQVLSAEGRPRERISEIAWRHGFTDEKYFSRIFKAEFGYTPRETPEQQRQSRETAERD